jgi:hypothetical protein
MLAAYDPASAALQWSYLDASARAAQKAVPADLAERLDAQAARVNENYAIGARLARALGLEALEPVDDFEDLDAYAQIEAALDRRRTCALAAIWKAPVYQDPRLPRNVSFRRPAAALSSAQLTGVRRGGRRGAGAFLPPALARREDAPRAVENRNLKIAAHTGGGGPPAGGCSSSMAPPPPFLDAISPARPAWSGFASSPSQRHPLPIGDR